MMGTENRGFSNLMTRVEFFCGLAYLPFHVIGVNFFIVVYMASSGNQLSDVFVNAVYYGIGVVFVFVFMRGFMRRGFDALLNNPGNAAISVGAGYLFEFFLSQVAAFLVLYIAGDLNNPNNSAVYELVIQDYSAFFMISAVMAPVVEEVLFRGVVFGGIRTRSRAAAYILSTVFFAFYHIVWHLIWSGDPVILVYMLQYVPASLALAWCYERSGSIWAPIILHALINATSMLFLS